VTDEEQEARSLKFEPRGSVTLRQLSTGRFALYPLGGVGEPFWIGDASGIAEAYAARPAPVKHERLAKPVAGIDLAALKINI
jgi:hypothetical protein